MQLRKGKNERLATNRRLVSIHDVMLQETETSNFLPYELGYCRIWRKLNVALEKDQEIAGTYNFQKIAWDKENVIPQLFGPCQWHLQNK